jgi:Glycosyl hydrolases family 43
MVRAVAPPPRHRPATGSLAAALLLACCLAGLALAPPAVAQTQAATTYTNPVSRDFADTFADPAVIRAKDGYWYAYGTTDPLRESEGTRHIIPTARSADLVNWTHVGDAFTESTKPSWATPDAALWAPDIRYLDGTYYLYYVVTQTTVTAGPNDNAIGVATAPSPTGPWTDSGDPVVGPRPGASGNPDDFKWTFDPAQFTDLDGTRYLYSAPTTAGSSSPSSARTAPRRSASPPRSPSTTATRAPTSSATAAGTTCSPPRPTAAPARPPVTRCSPAARPARGDRSATATASRC